MNYEFDVQFFNRLVVEHMYACKNGEEQAAQSLREAIDYMKNKYPFGWVEFMKVYGAADMTTDLIKKLEALTGPDRYSDYAIGLASGYLKEADWPTKEEKAERGDTTIYVTYFNATAGAEWHGAIGACCPEFTSSVDEAIALAERVIPNCYWSVEAGCSIIRDDSYDYSSQNPIPAIALCIAILKAKEASHD